MDTSGIYGVDVSKRELVIAGDAGGTEVVRLANQATAIDAWLDRLPAGSLIGMEATGTYHRLLATRASARGFTVYVVNPRDFHFYARSVGVRGKTDPLDARLLVRYLAHEHAHLHRYVQPSALCEQLCALLERRAMLVRTHQTVVQSMAELPGLQMHTQATLRAIDDLVAAIDCQLATLNASDPARATLVRRLRTICGVGPLVSTLLATLLQRFAFRHADALVAYVGLDPRPDESGSHRGRRRLSKRGHPEWRRLLVAAAMSAARTRVWQDYVQRHKDKGLPSTAVHVILARKLLRVAYAMYKSGRDFNPPCAQTT